MDVPPEKEARPSLTLEEIFEPWELRGESRRDCIPHRTSLLVPLSLLSTILASLSILLIPLGLVGLILDIHGGGSLWSMVCLTWLLGCLSGCPLSFLTRRMARRDLDLIFAGEMDHRGYKLTEKARSDSHAALWLSLWGLGLGIFLCLFPFLCYLIMAWVVTPG